MSCAASDDEFVVDSELVEENVIEQVALVVAILVSDRDHELDLRIVGIGGVGSSEVPGIVLGMIHGDEFTFDPVVLADLEFALMAGGHGEGGTEQVRMLEQVASDAAAALGSPLQEAPFAIGYGSIARVHVLDELDEGGGAIVALPIVVADSTAVDEDDEAIGANAVLYRLKEEREGMGVLAFVSGATSV